MAKYTINPAKAHGMDKVIGSIEVRDTIYTQLQKKPISHYLGKL